MPRKLFRHPLPVLAGMLLISVILLALVLNAVREHSLASTRHPAPRNRLGQPGGPDLAALVDPFTGTGVQAGAPFGGGATVPGATTPFGMVQFSPDTVNSVPGGYDSQDNRLRGFSLTHLSGAGCATFQDFPFLPVSGPITSSPTTDPEQYYAGFSHTREKASAGAYQVRLENGLQVELSATSRTGAARFTYPAGQPASLLIDLGGSISGVAQAQGSLNGNTVYGAVTSDGSFCRAHVHYTLYFYARFSQPIANSGTWSGGKLQPGSASVSSPQSGLYLTFAPGNSGVVTASVGISYVSVANAQANLASENPSGNFAAVQTQAHDAWNRALSQILVSGGTLMQTATFYTALYHSLLFPNLASDVNGQYSGFDDKMHAVAPGHAQYANFSGWDIYRSEMQLITLLDPARASDMAQSLVNDATQNGSLPRWSLAGRDLLEMVGDSADAVLADIYAFGGTAFDAHSALAAMVRQGTQPNPVRPGLAYLTSKGYLPMDGTYPGGSLWGQAAIELEYNVDDFAISTLANALGERSVADSFLQRAQNWEKLLNPPDRYLEPRSLDGGFHRQPYNPASQRGWIEGNGAQYTWMVNFNLKQLFEDLGGNEAVVKRLDAFFTQLNTGANTPYAFMGNEPSLGVPWEYDYAGAPYRAQQVLRAIENTLFSTGPGGLPGNDDLGEMSSWYVWAALGMYPETPGSASLVLASPLFPGISIARQSGQTITIDAPVASIATCYVQSLTVNGSAHNAPWLPPSFIADGGRLSYTLANTPNPAWGADPASAPPSFGAAIPASIGKG